MRRRLVQSRPEPSALGVRSQFTRLLPQVERRDGLGVRLEDLVGHGDEVHDEVRGVVVRGRLQPQRREVPQQLVARVAAVGRPALAQHEGHVEEEHEGGPRLVDDGDDGLGGVVGDARHRSYR